MEINKIQNGVVIDHISPGKSFDIYYKLNLDKLDQKVAIIKNTESVKMGKKDILKIETDEDMDFSALGYIDSDITINVIKKAKIINKYNLSLPEVLTNVIKCKNPRCITSVEKELDQVFKLSDIKTKVYRCIYCESKYDNN